MMRCKANSQRLVVVTCGVEFLICHSLWFFNLHYEETLIVDDDDDDDDEPLAK